jgi:hypothetical protein
MPMNRFHDETMIANRPMTADDRPGDPLTPNLIRIVRRALRRPNDRSPLARAVRAAAAQIDPGPLISPLAAEELRVRQVARRMSALLAADFRDSPGRSARLETVCA